MDQGFPAGIVDDVSVRTNSTSIDGVRIFLAVVRDENGTQLVIDATENKPGYLRQADTIPGTGATLQLHDLPYDPDL